MIIKGIKGGPLLLLLLLLSGSCVERENGIIILTDETVRKYIAAAPEIKRIYREELARGESPLEIRKNPRIKALLKAADFSWETYLRTDGSINNALLCLERPETFKKNFSPSDAPEENVEIVKKYIEPLRNIWYESVHWKYSEELRKRSGGKDETFENQ